MPKLEVGANEGKAPEGDQLRYCEYCRLWRHKTQFRVEGESCRWCWAAFVSRRDHGIRTGTYSPDELTAVLAMTDPPSPWMPGDVQHFTYAAQPTIQELNAPFLGKDRAADLPEVTEVVSTRLWLPTSVSYRLPGRGLGSSPTHPSPKGKSGS